MQYTTAAGFIAFTAFSLAAPSTTVTRHDHPSTHYSLEHNSNNSNYVVDSSSILIIPDAFDNPSCPRYDNEQYVDNDGTAFIIECGIDRSGTDLPNMPLTTESFSACMDACGATKSCVTLSYLAQMNLCWLKSTWGPDQQTDGRYVSGALVLSREVVEQGAQVVELESEEKDESVLHHYDFPIDARETNDNVGPRQDAQDDDETLSEFPQYPLPGCKLRVLPDGTELCTRSLPEVMKEVRDEHWIEERESIHDKVWEEIVLRERRNANLARRRGEVYDAEAVLDKFAEKLFKREIQLQADIQKGLNRRQSSSKFFRLSDYILDCAKVDTDEDTSDWADDKGDDDNDANAGACATSIDDGNEYTLSPDINSYPLTLSYSSMIYGLVTDLPGSSIISLTVNSAPSFTYPMSVTIKGSTYASKLPRRRRRQRLQELRPLDRLAPYSHHPDRRME